MRKVDAKKLRYRKELFAIIACLVILVTMLVGKSHFDKNNQPKNDEPKHTVVKPQEKKEKKEDGPTLPIRIDDNGKVVETYPKDNTADHDIEVDADINGDGFIGDGVGYFTIEKGDTLWDIAVAVYGDGSKWTKLYEDNKDIFLKGDARNATQPGHWIHPGQVIQINSLSDLSDH
jgi:nucleoid-associated protein YgaU